MDVPQILVRVYGRYLETGRVPKAKFDSAVQMESLRKIGRWRKVLWICGLVKNERKRLYPQVRFGMSSGRVAVSAASLRALNKLRSNGSHLKDRIA